MPTIDPKQIAQKWEEADRQVKGQYIKEGMLRHPDSLEKAYQWAADKIKARENPPPTEDLMHTPKPYTGTI